MQLHKKELTEKNIQTKKYNIYTRTSRNSDFKNKTPFVLVHGLGISSIYMVPVGELLASEFHVHLIDLPGFGNSEKPKHILSIPELADSLIQFLDACDIRSAHFLGNSFGCQVIADMASRYPDRVTSIILTGPTVDPAHRTFLEQAKAFKKDAKLEPKWQEKAAIKDYKKEGVIHLTKTIKLTLDDEIEKKLPHITAPTLVVYGEKDPFVEERWAQEIIHLLPNGTLVEIPGKGHTVNSNAPEQLAQITISFLNEQKLN